MAFDEKLAEYGIHRISVNLETVEHQIKEMKKRISQASAVDMNKVVKKVVGQCLNQNNIIVLNNIELFSHKTGIDKLKIALLYELDAYISIQIKDGKLCYNRNWEADITMGKYKEIFAEDKEIIEEIFPEYRLKKKFNEQEALLCVINKAREKLMLTVTEINEKKGMEKLEQELNKIVYTELFNKR